MARNRIQFQKGLSLPEFLQLYGAEAQCEAAWEKARCPDGFRCPRRFAMAEMSERIANAVCCCMPCTERDLRVADVHG